MAKNRGMRYLKCNPQPNSSKPQSFLFIYRWKCLRCTLLFLTNTLHYLCDIHAHSRPIRHHRSVRANALFVLAHFRQCEVPSNSPQTIQELHHSSAWVLVGGRTLYWSRPLADCCLIMANFVILHAILHIWMKVQARLPRTACQ